ncbi:hypothetical protein [uncultured Winogradskyella sp.]|uniref:hypothetical protein n=1 Tax=uncultured Winogradskyella sp. TaxID=395353 RepID=UPI0030EE2AC9|tara:strand:+ start:182 stop:409 length:228 start_codon:yes stop_codon:yes gene_type:complete
MQRKLGGQRIDKIREQYPGYYQKRGNWRQQLEYKKLKEVKDTAIKTSQNNVIMANDYANALDSLDNNINKLFNLI